VNPFDSIGAVSSVAGSDVRLAELVASMSLATDLGLGQPMEHVLRSCVLGLRIAEDIERRCPAQRAPRGNTYASTDKFGATGSNIRATKPRRE
jgi:hypothetical protein